MARMKFMNTEIDNLTMQETLRAIDQLIQEKKSAYVVTPNVDTYYSRLWMDMNEEPVVFEFPDVKDRFCNIQVLDAWTNTRMHR